MQIIVGADAVVDAVAQHAILEPHSHRVTCAVHARAHGPELGVAVDSDIDAPKPRVGGVGAAEGGGEHRDLVIVPCSERDHLHQSGTRGEVELRPLAAEVENRVTRRHDQALRAETARLWARLLHGSNAERTVPTRCADGFGARDADPRVAVLIHGVKKVGRVEACDLGDKGRRRRGGLHPGDAAAVETKGPVLCRITDRAWRVARACVPLQHVRAVASLHGGTV